MLRMQSARKIASRRLIIFDFSGDSWSAGICERAWFSALDMKSKNIPGIIQNTSAMPAVQARLIHRYFMCLATESGSSTIFFRVIIAKRGMVNSAMTRMLATVLNLAYIGM